MSKFLNYFAVLIVGVVLAIIVGYFVFHYPLQALAVVCLGFALKWAMRGS